LKWLCQHIPLSGTLVWHDVSTNRHLLDLYNDPRLPFTVNGGTDIVVVNDLDIESDFPESIYAVMDLKKRIERRHVMKIVVARLITPPSRNVNRFPG